MKKEIIFNKTLGITENDIRVEKDLLKLSEWRNKIFEQVSNMKLQLTKMDKFKEETGEFADNDKYIQICEAKQKQSFLLKLTDNQISFLKQLDKREKTLGQYYMEIAKEHISDDLHALIVKKAQVKLMR